MFETDTENENEDDDYELDFKNIFNLNFDHQLKINKMIKDFNICDDKVSKLKTSATDTFLLRDHFECIVCFERIYIDDGCVTCSSAFENPSDLPSTSHSLCITCVRNYAHSAITDIPVAHGGLGLRCAFDGCKNVILLSEFEIYLGDEDYLPLKLRLQEQCLVDAGLNDLVTCPGCELKVCVDPTVPYYRCNCGRQQCRVCPRPYDAQHQNKTCHEMDDEEAQKSSIIKLEPQIYETVIRKCHRCNLAFVKLEGCNKMTCRCGAKQCYVCRQKDIEYEHFCQCGDIQERHGQCTKCRKSCRVWENAEELDQIKIDELQQG